MTYLGFMTTKRGVNVEVWYDKDSDSLYAEREQLVRVTGGWKRIVKPYKVTAEIESRFAERIAR